MSDPLRVSMLSVVSLLSQRETAAVLGVSVKTVIRLVRAGQLIPVRIGSRTLFDPDDLDSFIKSCKRTARSDGPLRDVVPNPQTDDGRPEN
jgi:excisionase family DNA binding protein